MTREQIMNAYNKLKERDALEEFRNIYQCYKGDRHFPEEVIVTIDLPLMDTEEDIKARMNAGVVEEFMRIVDNRIRLLNHEIELAGEKTECDRLEYGKRIESLLEIQSCVDELLTHPEYETALKKYGNYSFAEWDMLLIDWANEFEDGYKYEIDDFLDQVQEFAKLKLGEL